VFCVPCLPFFVRLPCIAKRHRKMFGISGALTEGALNNRKCYALPQIDFRLTVAQELDRLF